MVDEFSCLVVVAQNSLHVCERDFLFRSGKDGEAAALSNVLLQRRSQHLLNLPDARIVVGDVSVVVADVRLGKVECAVLLGIVEAVFLCPADERFGGHEVRTLRIVLLQPALIAGSKVLVLRETLREPLMPRPGFEVPGLVLINLKVVS